MWPFSPSKKEIAKQETERREREEAEAATAEANESRRKAAQQRILDNLRAAQEAREATVLAETAHIGEVAAKRRRTDTAVREVKQKHSELSEVMQPKNGKSVAELAMEELERSESEQETAS